MALLTDMATLWRSTRDVSEFKVEPHLQAAVNLFFDELERKNGKVVVEKTFLLGTSFCVQNRQVFSLYRFN
jgi:hypothetical protein